MITNYLKTEIQRTPETSSTVHNTVGSGTKNYEKSLLRKKSDY